MVRALHKEQRKKIMCLNNIWNAPSKVVLGPMAVTGLCVGWEGRLTAVNCLEFVIKYFLRSLIVEVE